MPRKSRSEVQSPESEPRRRSSRLAALPQTSPEPKRTPRTPKTPTSAEKPERRGRPAGSTKKAASPKKETRGRKRKVVTEAAVEDEPEAKTSKDTEDVAAEMAQDDEESGGAGDALKEAGDAAPDAKEEENGKAEPAETKEEKMETNQDTAQSQPIPKPVIQAAAPAVQNPVVTIVKGQMSQPSSSAAGKVKKPIVVQASTPPKVIKPTPAPTVACPAVIPIPITTQSAPATAPSKPIPLISQSPPKQTVQSIPATVVAPSPPKQASDPPTPQLARTEDSQTSPSTAPEPPKTAPVAPPQEEPQPQQTPQVHINTSPVHNDPTSAQNVAGPMVVDSAKVVDSPLQQQQQQQPPKQQTVTSGPSNPQTEDGESTDSAQVDNLSAFRKCPPSLPPLQYLTKPEITITPASDAEHSPTPGSPGGAESDDFEEKVDEKPVDEPTKEQAVPNNNTPPENIDNLKKDAIQHDGLNNGESVTPATVAV